MTALASSTSDILYSAFVTATDGLRLHARCYGRPGTTGIPVVCLPGLARTAADFDVLATALSRDGPRPRRVIALDYRGRGLSQYDHNPANYSLPLSSPTSWPSSPHWKLFRRFSSAHRVAAFSRCSWPPSGRPR